MAIDMLLLVPFTNYGNIDI